MPFAKRKKIKLQIYHSFLKGSDEAFYSRD
jgi:hypothetical protein